MLIYIAVQLRSYEGNRAPNTFNRENTGQMYWRGPNYRKDFAIFQLFCNYNREKHGGKYSKVQG